MTAAPTSPLEICKHTLHTPRLTLHLYDTSNVDQSAHALNLFNDPVALSAMGDYGIRNIDQVISLAVACHLRPNTHHTMLTTEGFCYVIHLGVEASAGDTSSMIGIISLMQRSDEGAPDIGWMMLHQSSGQGYATEASKEALRYWSQELHLKSILCFVSPKNLASCQIALKIGLVGNGETFVDEESGKDCMVYELPRIRDGEKDVSSIQD